MIEIFFLFFYLFKWIVMENRINRISLPQMCNMRLYIFIIATYAFLQSSPNKKKAKICYKDGEKWEYLRQCVSDKSFNYVYNPFKEKKMGGSSKRKNKSYYANASKKARYAGQGRMLTENMRGFLLTCNNRWKVYEKAKKTIRQPIISNVKQ